MTKFEWLEFQTPFIGLQMYSGRLEEHDKSNNKIIELIDGMQFWTRILFYRHKTVLGSPWLCCIDKWHAESL
jgi:hypothetical protein